MATLVFGMNLSLDGYVDHLKMQTGPALFRHWTEHVRGLAGSVYGRRIYELIPNTKVVLKNWLGRQDTPLELNGDGFRDRDYAKPKPPGVHRVVGIGDSFMFGWGLKPGKDYLSLLEERLAAEAPTARWEVLNMGVPGYNTAMEVETLKARRGISVRLTSERCGSQLWRRSASPASSSR